MLQLDVFAEREVDAFFQTRAQDRAAEILVIAIVKRVPGKFALDLVRERDEKGRDVVEKKVNKLVVGDDNQHLRLGSFEVGTKLGKGLFGVPAELLLRLRGRLIR